ncbi:hypothetical protein IQ07DRAFT_604184 [Pyrenochaeta sp. DS3sAY3a]|nr:hypothetical protein IQ07DRAFT_604184 [Pyrenochaeta sp. DS3sAY3a]
MSPGLLYVHTSSMTLTPRLGVFVQSGNAAAAAFVETADWDCEWGLGTHRSHASRLTSLLLNGPVAWRMGTRDERSWTSGLRRRDLSDGEVDKEAAAARVKAVFPYTTSHGYTGIKEPDQNNGLAGFFHYPYNVKEEGLGVEYLNQVAARSASSLSWDPKRTLWRHYMKEFWSKVDDEQELNKALNLKRMLYKLMPFLLLNQL